MYSKVIIIRTIYNKAGRNLKFLRDADSVTFNLKNLWKFTERNSLWLTLLELIYSNHSVLLQLKELKNICFKRSLWENVKLVHFISTVVYFSNLSQLLYHNFFKVAKNKDFTENPSTAFLYRMRRDAHPLIFLLY